MKDGYYWAKDKEGNSWKTWQIAEILGSSVQLIGDERCFELEEFEFGDRIENEKYA